MMSLIAFAIIVIAISFNVVCVVSVENYHLASKTPYRMSVDLDSKEYFPSQQRIIPDICVKSSVKHVLGHFRHGTRYPSAKDLLKASKIVEKVTNPPIKMQLESVITAFKNHEEKELSESGRKELESIGVFFFSYFTDFFRNVNEKDLNFVITSKSRTKSSYLGFIDGFNKALGKNLTTTPVENDILLRFFDRCTKYIKEIGDNKTNTAVVSTFMQKMDRELVAAFATLMQQPDFILEESEMLSYFIIAATELSVLNTSSWLKFTNERVRNILEYASDLKNYWSKGPAHSLSYEQSCGLLVDMFQMFENVLSGKNSSKGSFYFSHAETIIPLLNILGLFKEDPLLTDKNFDQMQNRLFRATRVSPFASNVAFVLHQCGDANSNNRDNVYLQLFFKEHPIAWPLCNNSFCEYNDLRQYYSRYIDNCNFNMICQVNDSGVFNGDGGDINDEEDDDDVDKSSSRDSGIRDESDDFIVDLYVDGKNNDDDDGADNRGDEVFVDDDEDVDTDHSFHDDL
ncbi:hypothetical protein HELRODRAFT_111769 [Helobdella robusta]|uniref:Multiple inositol polyphosphate phosphatase 1 n=1 Tax=Helobdella robusta TaxID=6412 RepID=T1EFE3_HELRO|nr:hypothetical protein HELRODRAFT_111769 [Helobdella robusta]ESO04777.1 hypothetical protein HELRODRAFT_111769 [Helobdella robusta]